MTKRKCLSSDSINDVFIVENICKKKIRSNKEPLYFIKWKDWDDKFNTWEPLSNILDKSLIDIFEEEQKEKQKTKKDTLKTLELNVQKESEISETTIETKSSIELGSEKSIEKQEIEEKLDKLSNKTESRPKICLKIPKHRIHAPCVDSGKKPHDNNLFNQEIEKSKKSQNIDEDWRFSSHFSPNYFSNDDCTNKCVNENSFRENKQSHRPEFSWTRHSLSFTDKSFKSFDQIIRKPRKLLSINEYSAKMKKHHKKSSHDKHKSERKPHLHFTYKNQNEVNLENKVEQKPEPKSARPQHERPLISLENQIETWSEKSSDKNLFNESVKNVEVKPVVERFKYHANTIVTDVTIRNLSVTIREMPYEDFIDSETSRYLKIRVPKQSDWLMRYRGNTNEMMPDDNDSITEDISDEPPVEENKLEILRKSDKKKLLLERFTESIIHGLRPPSRPRSVDSYKAAIDKSYPGGGKNPFSSSTSPMKISAECQVEQPMREPCVQSKSPLHVIIDECEEVDVVGGIESDHSFVGSLQAETVTVSTQIRQSLPINTSPVTSIIQSLLQSYSYNHSMMMPPLQAAPWMESQATTNQLYQMPHHQSNHSGHRISSVACLPPSSIEPSMLKYTENACLLYRQPTGFLPEIFLNTSQDTPIDLSFK